MTEHLKILHWNNGFIHITSEGHKWDEISLTVTEQRELLNYLLINIEKHEGEAKKDAERNAKLREKAEREIKSKNTI